MQLLTVRGLSAGRAGTVRDVNDTDLPLAAQFPAASEQDWTELVAGVLRKSGVIAADAPAAAAIDALTDHTVAGVDRLPLYTKSSAPAADAGFPGVFPFVRGGHARGAHDTGWDVRAWHADPDAALTRTHVLTDLENGAHSLWLRIGPRAITVGDLDEILADVYLDSAAVSLAAGVDAGPAADALLSVASERGVEHKLLRGSLGFDPVGLQARTGVEQGWTDAVRWSRRCLADLPGVRPIVIDAQVYHEAGGDDAQELAYSLAAGVIALRELEAAGLGVSDALSLLEFQYAVTDEQFLSTAKLRAARLLWARVASACGVAGPPAAQRQHAVTSWAMTTRRDPWVNMLRSTVACFAAGIGGADAVTVLPYDVALGFPDVTSRRVARNTQSILTAESNLGRVIDPSGGSWYVESLTRALARASWSLFQQVESAGGISAALASGQLAEALEASAQARRSAYAHREQTITGVTEFPNLHEQSLARNPYQVGAPRGGGLPRRRYAEPYEALRDRVDALSPPLGDNAILVAAFGSPRDYGGRLEFAKGALAPGGVDPAVMPADATTPGARVVVLCGSDAAYQSEGQAVATRVREAGAALVLAVGRPLDLPFAVDGWLSSGGDLLSCLAAIIDALEASG